MTQVRIHRNSIVIGHVGCSEKLRGLSYLSSHTGDANATRTALLLKMFLISRILAIVELLRYSHGADW